MIRHRTGYESLISGQNMIDLNKDLGLKEKPSLINRIIRKWRKDKMSNNNNEKFLMTVAEKDQTKANTFIVGEEGIQEICNPLKIKEIPVKLPIIGYNMISNLTDCSDPSYRIPLDLKIISIIDKAGQPIKLEKPIGCTPRGTFHDNGVIGDTICGQIDMLTGLSSITSCNDKISAVIFSGELIKQTPLSELTRSDVDNMEEKDREELMRNLEKVLSTIDNSNLARVVTVLSEDSTLREFKGKEIADEIGDMLQKKNSDYGSAVYKDYKKHGTTAILVWLGHKMNRLESLNAKRYADVENESSIDTLKDIAGYAICGLDALGYHHNKDVK